MKYATYRNSQTQSNGNNTRRAAKRRKMRTKENTPVSGAGNPIAQIYAKSNNWTDAVIADESTERRLSKYGPPTSTRLAGYNFIW